MAAVPAFAATSRDELVRPGKSVGKFRVGVSEAELRRSAGKPNYVVDEGGSFGRKRVEYHYGAGAATVFVSRIPNSIRRATSRARSCWRSGCGRRRGNARR